MQLGNWLTQATAQLTASDSAKLDAELLVCWVLQRNRAWLYGFKDYQLSAAELERLGALLSRRQAGEPIAYLTGQREFWSLMLNTNPSTLIPRPDTETLVEW